MPPYLCPLLFSLPNINCILAHYLFFHYIRNENGVFTQDSILGAMRDLDVAMALTGLHSYDLLTAPPNPLTSPPLLYPTAPSPTLPSPPLLNSTAPSPILPYPTLPHPTLHYPITPYRTLPSPPLPCRSLPYFTLPSFAQPNLAISYPIFPCRTLPYPPLLSPTLPSIIALHVAK